MGTTIDREDEKAWDSVQTLSKIDEEQAEIVLKMVVSHTLEELDLEITVIEDLHFKKPEPQEIEKLRELHREMKKELHRKQTSYGYELLVDYIDFISQMVSKNQQLTRKRLLASLLARQASEKRTRRSQNHTPSEKAFYSTTDVAKKLGLSDQTIRRMCENGRFPDAYRTAGGH